MRLIFKMDRFGGFTSGGKGRGQVGIYFQERKEEERWKTLPHFKGGGCSSINQDNLRGMY